MEERHYLIGTAGHVDHGKTQLIRALTGIETDRLKEEKLRGISIELGFAHLLLPSGRNVGIVDVPGHERFVRQMLAGATGMDMVLLVIAADEGIMPQTKEHLDILTLLGVSQGIVVLNKIDLVDNDWLELIQEEIREGLIGSVFEGSPIFRVSAAKGIGIKELIAGIDKSLDAVQSKNASGPVRLPIDRVFTVQGFGTVVTGTLHNGTIQLGQDVAIEPINKIAKVRSIQVHNEKTQYAEAGQRVAVNLAGIDVDDITKGSVVINTGAYSVSTLLDLKVRNLSSADKPLTQRQRVRFHIGTAEVLGRIHLLDSEELLPGQEGYAQIILEEEIVTAPQDRFVIRFYSPAYTVAGGKVLGAAKVKRKRFNKQAIAQMQLLEQGDPLVLLERELATPMTIKDCEDIFHVEQEEINKWLEKLREQKRIELWEDETNPVYWNTESVQKWKKSVVDQITAYHKNYPLRGGIGREELKSKIGIKWPHRRWQNILEQGARRSYYRLYGGKVQNMENPPLPESLNKKLLCLRKRWENAKLAPPDLESGAQACGINKNEMAEFTGYLTENEEWVPIEGLYFAASALEIARRDLIALLETLGAVTVGDVREVWGTSRKYLVPLLEYYDQQKVTIRQGDKRILYT